MFRNVTQRYSYIHEILQRGCQILPDPYPNPNHNNEHNEWKYMVRIDFKKEEIPIPCHSTDE